jgi:glycosidase
MRAAILGLLLASACGNGGPIGEGWRTTAGQSGDWRDEVIYQLLVDRFGNGERLNDYRVVPGALGLFQGGDWQGVIDHLDYLETLGVTALWISPAVRNLETDANFDSYHGYWQQDFVRPNPHFGDLGKLRELVNAAHGRGMKVILDIVTNHVGQLFYYDVNGNGHPDDAVYGAGCGVAPPADRMPCPAACLRCTRNSDCPALQPESPGDPAPIVECRYNVCTRPDSTCVQGATPIVHLTEYDPDFDPEGVRGWTSLGFSGLAQVNWIYDPAINRMPTLPGARAGRAGDEPFAFNRLEWYHRKGRIYDYSARQQVLEGDFPGGLKDLATEREDVREALTAVFARWIQTADFDGFRIDTLKHVEPEFWEYFCTRLRQWALGKITLKDPTVEGNPDATVPVLSVPKQKFFMFGESFDGSDDLNGGYTQGQGVDSIFHFAQKFSVFDQVFKRSGPTQAIADQLQRTRDKYGATPKDDGIGVAPREALVNFLDNHDVTRFLFDKPSLPALHNALAFLFTENGIPCLYYGTEQELYGGNDPENRERLWDTGYRTDGATFRFIQRLIKLRKAYAPLRRGDLTVRWATSHTGSERDAGIFAFERADGGRRVLVVLNTSDGHTAETADASDMMTSFAAGTELHDVLSEAGERVTVGAGGTLVVRLGPRQQRVFVPAGEVVPF